MNLHIIVFVLTALAFPASSQACKCAGLPSYDAVFEGRVERTLADPAQPRQFTEVQFSVASHSIGEIGRKATVYTPLPVLMCGVSFEVGRSYLVRASRVHGRLETLDCYGTKEQVRGSTQSSRSVSVTKEAPNPALQRTAYGGR